MTAPTPVKTWQIVPNILVSGGSDEHIHAQNVMFAIHSSLLGFGSNPWLVNYSCDSSVAGSAGDAVDRWVAATNIVWSTGAHSWIVYDLPGGAQLLISMIYSTSNCEDAHMRVSPSGAFTGGTTTVDPTATDEQVVIVTTTGITTEKWWSGQGTSSSFDDTDKRIHVWHSTDGLLTRVAIYRADNCLAFWEFGDMADKRAGQASAFTWGVYANHITSSPGIDVLTSSYMFDHSWLYSYYLGGTLLYNCCHLSLGFSSMPWTEELSANIAEEIDGDLHCTPFTLWSKVVGARGFKGTVIDRWLSPHQALAKGDNSPDTPSSRDFVHMESIMLPWTGDSTVMLTA